MMIISEDFLFRLEKFGGILINKVTFDRIELDESEAYFYALIKVFLTSILLMTS